MKKTNLVGITLAMSLMMTFASFAGTWHKADNGRWWYENDDGSYRSNGWATIDNKYYYFDSEGYILTDTITPDGYMVNQDGQWVVDGLVKTASGENKEIQQQNGSQQSAVLDEILYADLDEPIFQIDNFIVRFDGTETLSELVEQLDSLNVYTTDYDPKKHLNPYELKNLTIYKNGKTYVKITYKNQSSEIHRCDSDTVVLTDFSFDGGSHSSSASDESAKNIWLPKGFNLYGTGIPEYDEDLYEEYRSGKDKVLGNRILKKLSIKYPFSGDKYGNYKYIYLFFDEYTLECKEIWWTGTPNFVDSDMTSGTFMQWF